METREWLANSNAAPPTRPAAPSTGYSQGGATPTKPGAYWYHQISEELRNLILFAGIVLDATVLTQLRQAVKRLTGSNVTAINFAASPFALTADNAGLVSIDATAGNVVVNLPAANVLAALKYELRRIDTSANTVTVNRAGADTIDEGGVSFTLAAKGVQKIAADGTSKWVTGTPVAASQAEANAGTDDAKFITSKKLRFGFAASLTANGYIAFPTWLLGWIVQWGFINSSAGSATFPIAFPTAALFVLQTADQNNVNPILGNTVFTASTSTTGFTRGATGVGSFWISVGN